MNLSYFILVVMSLIAGYVIALNIAAVSHHTNKLLKMICIILFCFSLCRYITLLVYGDHPSYETLVFFRRFYFATTIGLTVPILSAVWYVTPCYREKVKYAYWLLLLLPWVSFYGYLMVKQPVRIVQSKTIGYILELTGTFPCYMLMAQAAFTILVVILALGGMLRYGHLQIRAQLIMLILAQSLLMIDGLSVYKQQLLQLVPSFTISEILAFLAVYYSLAVPVKETKGIEGR